MSSYLTFSTSTMDDDGQRRPIAVLQEPDELQCLSTAFVQRLREGSMPPDDAYWWTRALCEEIAMRDALQTGQPYVDIQCRVA